MISISAFPVMFENVYVSVHWHGLIFCATIRIVVSIWVYALLHSVKLINLDSVALDLW